MSERRVGDTRYAPLLWHLAALPADQASVTLSLAAIEAILGTALPTGARTTGFWFGLGTRSLHRAGWHARLALQRDAVIFRRFHADQSRRQSSDYAAIVAAYQAGASVTTLTQQFARSRVTVYHVLRRAGIPLRGRR